MTTFAQGRHNLGAFVVYLCGIEVPVGSIQAQFSIGGQDPTLLITLAPDIYITRFGAQDRVDVQVFYLDRIYDSKNPKFCLLFDGVITGWSFQRDLAGVSVMLTAKGTFSALRSLIAHYLSDVNDVVSAMVKQPTGTDAQVISAVPFPWNFILSFSEFDNSEGGFTQVVKRPFDFFYNFMRLVLGGKSSTEFGSIPSAYFYSKYAYRTSLHKRIVASPLIEESFMLDADLNIIPQFPIFEAVQTNIILSALSNAAQNAGVNAPILDTILLLLQHMYFELLFVPAPSFVYINHKTDFPQFDSDRIYIWSDEISLPGKIQPDNPNDDKKVWPGLAEAVTKPNWFFGAPPVCNVIFPSMMSEVHFEESYISQPTRTYVNDTALASMFGSVDADLSAATNMCAGYPPQVQVELDKRFSPQTGTYDPYKSGKNFLVWPDEFYLGPIANFVDLPPWLMFLLEAQISTTDKALVEAKDYLKKYTGMSDSEESDLKKLNTELKKAATELESINNSSMSGEDKNEKLEEVQEKIGELKAQIEEKSKAIKQNAEQNFSKLKADLIVLFSENTALRTAVSQVSNFSDLVSIIFSAARSPVQNLYIKYAAFEHWRTKAEQRAGSITILFNPYIVPGFTMFVFDTSATGQHFLAYITDVRHEMSPNGWLTQISFSHVILLQEYIELLLDARLAILNETTLGDVPLELLEMALEASLAIIEEKSYEEESGEPLSEVIFSQEFGVSEEKEEEKLSTKEILKNQIQSAEELKQKFIENPKYKDWLAKTLIGAPRNPIFQYEVLTQHRLPAHEYFRRLLWRNDPKRVHSCVFDLPQMIYLNYTDPKDPKKTVSYSLQQVLETHVDYILNKATKTLDDLGLSRFKTREGVLGFISISPASSIVGLFNNYELALKFGSRPVCSLDDYVKFRNAKRFCVEPSGAVSSEDGRFGKGAKYYRQLYTLEYYPELMTDIQTHPNAYFNENNIFDPVADTRVCLYSGYGYEDYLDEIIKMEKSEQTEQAEQTEQVGQSERPIATFGNLKDILDLPYTIKNWQKILRIYRQRLQMLPKIEEQK